MTDVMSLGSKLYFLGKLDKMIFLAIIFLFLEFCTGDAPQVKAFVAGDTF
jgi:hypothetical protein